MKRRVRLRPDEIEIGERMRQPVDDTMVENIAASVAKIGLQNPISVYFKDGVTLDDGDPVDHVPFLAAGLHRLKALIKLGTQFVECEVFETEREARMWEISENLHRADLTQLQRDNHVAMWISLVDEDGEKKPAQLAQVSKGGRGNRGGISEAAREFGIDRDDARRAMKVASLSEEAKEAARAVGLDDNRSALLKAAQAAPERQATVIRDMAEAKSASRNKIDRDVAERAIREAASIIIEHVPAEYWDGLKANLYAGKCGPLANEISNITGQSIMDRGFG